MIAETKIVTHRCSVCDSPLGDKEITINPLTGAIVYRGIQAVLRDAEMSLFKLFMENFNKAVPLNASVEALNAAGFKHTQQNVRIHVHYLRGKLAHTGLVIYAQRGGAYMLAEGEYRPQRRISHFGQSGAVL